MPATAPLGATRTDAQPANVTEPIGRARELHRSGLEAVVGNRPVDAIRLLRRGIAVLHASEAASGADGAEWLRVRIRLSITLGYCIAEIGSLADGLAELEAARQYIARLPDGRLRAELHGLADHNHGGMLGRVGHREEAIAILGSAIQHEERALADGTDDPAGLIDALMKSLNARGGMYAELGRPGPAKRDLNRAIALATEHRLPFWVAVVKHVLGNVARLEADVPKALRCYQEADRTLRELAPGRLSRLRLDQAEALLIAGLADEAGKHLDEALPQLHRKRIGQDLAEAELFRAAAALLAGDLEMARRLAASARRRLLRRGSGAWAAVAALIGLRVDTMLVLDGRRAARSLPTKALRLAREFSELQLKDEAALARMLAVRLELRRGAVSRAAALLEGVPTPRRITPIDHRMLLRLCKAELAVAEGNRRKALAQARAGLTELGRVRDRMGGLELVSGTALHGRELGELAVHLELDGATTDARRLFSWLERTRAQVYRYEPLPPIEDPQLAERIAEIRHLASALQQARLEGRPTDSLSTRYAALQREAMRLGWQAIRWGKPRPVASITDVSEQLGDRALVSFASSGEAMVAVVVADGHARMIRLGSATQAAETARQLHADLNALAPDYLSQPLGRAISQSAQRRAESLDAQLLRPLAGVIGDRDVVIVPTGALYAVSWGVLDSLRSRPTVVVPSATAWLTASQPERQPESRDSGRIVLVRGPGLPLAVGEVDKLAAHHPAAMVLTEEHAKVGAALDAFDGAQLAHIAAHGAHEPENALFSRLELADGALFAHETARLRRPPKQVVLAACELALNRIRPGDEALGFAGALLASGANTVIAAISRVGDQPSAAAMDDYHRRLAAGAAPAVALAEAVAVDPFRRPFVCLGCGH